MNAGAALIDAIEKLFHHFELAIIGAIGAVLSLRFHPEIQGRKQVLLFIATGACIAHFATGLAADYFSIQPARAGAVGFLLGIFGASLVDAAVRAIKAADLLAFFTRNKGNGQ
jgi:predicted MFS family arabinose efflux permease